MWAVYKGHLSASLRSPTCFPSIFLPTWSCMPLSTLQCLIISKTCKCIHIHGGTDAKLTVAGTHLTVPASQSASSRYGGRDVEGGGEEYKRERKQRGKMKKSRRRRRGEVGTGGDGGKAGYWNRVATVYLGIKKPRAGLQRPASDELQIKKLRWNFPVMPEHQSKCTSTSPPLSLSLSLSLSVSRSPTKARQMEVGAAVQSEQMAAPNLIYEINNVSQIECRHRNTLPEFFPLLLCICKSMREEEKQICNMSKFEDICIQV